MLVVLPLLSALVSNGGGRWVHSPVGEAPYITWLLRLTDSAPLPLALLLVSLLQA